MEWMKPWFNQTLQDGWTEMVKELEELQAEFNIPSLEKTMRDEGDVLVVEVVVPGWSRRHTVDVRVEENILFISGVFMDHTPSGVREETHFTMNQWLPVPVDETRLKTDIKPDGRLIVTIPKRQVSQRDEGVTSPPNP
ncbi:Hsp20/alpha crystallin family protein [Desmospora profundinema]|uniref:HSP20 family molecular chaperone IbpA n=1 Tax=Desmospora profundinema TaxID=1571184 RepID=A0ABU1IQ49_9BACL|nr:Hsp20/alpha crystallin family protein [Desmospora profundinema]MDR6226533.1 HSP20 family molecular chaperone IbpA [Desmospora profundinema]